MHRVTILAAATQLILMSMMGSPGLAQTASMDERAVRAKVEDFLERLGNRQVETLADDFTDAALIVVTRQRDGSFTSSTQTVDAWLAAMRRNPGGQTFQEPLTNVRVTVDSGALAYMRADFQIVRDGQVFSSGVDHFTLVREADGWKIAMVAYTSIPTASTRSEMTATSKQLIAHRGASAYAPEHTLAAYRLALEQGADFVEQDLGVTKDGVLVCLHDMSLERTTNVETLFPDRFTDVSFRDQTRKMWLVKDFTLSEVKQLDAGTWFDERFAGERIPTWQEAIDLVKGRAGLYPELKSPELYRDQGVDQVGLVARALRENGLEHADSDPQTPVILQSFDVDALEALALALPDLPRVFLFGVANSARWITQEGIDHIATFATGIGPAKGAITAHPALVGLAHDAGLTVTPYTFRSNDTGQFATVRSEMHHFLFSLGVDALFTNNPDEFPRRP